MTSRRNAAHRSSDSRFEGSTVPQRDIWRHGHCGIHSSAQDPLHVLKHSCVRPSCPMPSLSIATASGRPAHVALPRTYCHHSYGYLRGAVRPAPDSSRGGIQGRRLSCRSSGSSPEQQSASSSSPVYQGMYGPWSVEQADILEVWGYRVSLTAATVSCLAAAGICLTSSDSVEGLLNPLAATGAISLGVSLVLIHIYVTPIKRTLQALWAAGAAGGTYLALTHPEQPLPLFIADHPWAVWLVGPLFAAVTGVAIKEGICYGKPEAAGLAALVPLLLLGHLSQVTPTGSSAQQILLAATLATAAVFAGRKYVQPVKDDIGDKSVFEFRKLPLEQQQALLQQLQQQEL